MSPQSEDNRPDPDFLLSRIEEDERKQGRGRLKIFFGSSAGVGKTYAMLQEAHRKASEGVDVLIGLVETHGRPETIQLLEGLPILSRRKVSHRGVTLEEFDLDGAIARKPAILLLDELAHTNAPGSRHPKRWQDVHEILNCGIDVYTTLNVQHLESLNDVVESVTGIPVREMVPDLVFDEADNVVLVDTPPDELLRRLKDGKVYIAPGANERVVQNFFKKTNLLSLRELALRRTADYVDADTDDHLRREGVNIPNTAGDRIMVCLGADNFAAKLVRTGKRLSAALKSPWLAVYVETPKAAQSALRKREYMQQIFRAAERNGAEVVTLQANQIGDELLDYARTRGVTKIIIGKSVLPWWQRLFKRNLAEFVIGHSGEIDVYVVTTPATITAQLAKQKQVQKSAFPGEHYIYGLALLGFCTLFGEKSRGLISPDDMIMVYILGAMLAASYLNRGAGLFYAALAPAFFNYFFVEPTWTLDVYDHAYWLTFIVMLLVGLVISSQAARLREQITLARQRERETQLFYSFNKRLSVLSDHGAMTSLLRDTVGKVLNADISIWLSDQQFKITKTEGAADADDLKEQTVAQWTFQHQQPAGLGTDTMPGAGRYYLPLRGAEAPVGVVGAMPASNSDGLFLPDQLATLETLVDLYAAARDRLKADQRAEETRLLIEKEKLRNLLLSSVSHDLRSPLSAISGAAQTLQQERPQDEMLGSIARESSRLGRIINNLLDITRIEGGEIKLNIQPYYPPEIIGSAVEAVAERLKEHLLSYNMPDQIPLVRMDGLLISQLVQNLLENAAVHTPAGTELMITAVKAGRILSGAI